LSAEASERAILPFSALETRQSTDKCVQHFALNGCCLLNDAIPADICKTLADFVDARLLDARQQIVESGFDEATYVGEVFGKLRCREQRWDLKLPFEGPVAEAMVSLGSSFGGLLTQILGRDAIMTELSSIVSDPGAPQQPLHADTYVAESGMVSLLIALQPITRAMGPTVLCPRTHSPAGAKLLSALKPQGANEVEAQTPGYQDEVLEALKGVHASCDMGTAVMYDSRLLHCGGMNSLASNGGARRRVLVATFVDVRSRKTPRGSACTIRRELRGRFRLQHFLRADPTDSQAK